MLIIGQMEFIKLIFHQNIYRIVWTDLYFNSIEKCQQNEAKDFLKKNIIPIVSTKKKTNN